MNAKAPQLGIISKLNEMSGDDYALELKELGRCADVPHRIVRSQDCPAAIVNVMRASALTILSGSNDMIMRKDRSIDYQNPKVRNGLAALLYLIQEGETQINALFVCFSAQLLALALSIWEAYSGPKLSLEQWRRFKFSSLKFENPLVHLPAQEISVTQLDGLGPILSVHSQYVHPDRLKAEGLRTRRVQGRTAVMQFQFDGWQAAQFHPDLSLKSAERYSGGKLDSLGNTSWLLTERLRAAKLAS